MRAARALLLLPLLTWAAGLCSAQEPAKKSSIDESKPHVQGERGEAIAAWLKRAEARGFRGVVLAAQDGEVVCAQGVGAADLAGKVPNTPATAFEVASFTKQFTAAAVLRLVDRKALSLDAKLKDLLPGVPASCEAITVRHLLQHTSGIPGDNTEGAGTKLAPALAGFLRGGPKHTPGTHWEYWNQGYALLSEVIARTGKASYVDFVKRELFAPAGMRSSGFTGDTPPKGLAVAVGRSTDGPPRGAFEHPYGEYGFQYRGMGGAVTTAWDLWRWNQALDGELLSASSKKALFTPGLNDYALGWFVRKARGRLVQSHGGGVRGFICDVRRYPQSKGFLAVIANDDGAPLDVVSAGCEQLLFGEELSARFPEPVDAKLAKRLLGTYRNARGDRLIVEHEGKLLIARLVWASGPTTYFQLEPAPKGGVTAFDGQDRYPLKPKQDAKGVVTALELEPDLFERVR